MTLPEKKNPSDRPPASASVRKLRFDAAQPRLVKPPYFLSGKRPPPDKP